MPENIKHFTSQAMKLSVTQHPFDVEEEDELTDPELPDGDRLTEPELPDLPELADWEIEGPLDEEYHSPFEHKKTVHKTLAMANLYQQQAMALMAQSKDKKKLDPKAKVRNRGTVCVPASSAKDNKDHYPINNIDQARNALARVHAYDKAPPWYKGSLKGLQELVSRKVHSKYPSIGKEKKSSVEYLATKYAQTSGDQFIPLTKALPGYAAPESVLPQVEYQREWDALYAHPPSSIQAPDPNVDPFDPRPYSNFSQFAPSTPPTPQQLNMPKPATVKQPASYLPIPTDIQSSLNTILKTKLIPDGKLGPLTRAALDKFKTTYNVVSDATERDIFKLIRDTAARQQGQSGTADANTKINQLINYSHQFINHVYRDIKAATDSGYGLDSTTLGKYIQTIQTLYPQIQALQSLSLDDRQKMSVSAIIGHLQMISNQLESTTSLNVGALPRAATIQYLITKYAEPQAFCQVIRNYDQGTPCLKDFYVADASKHYLLNKYASSELFYEVVKQYDSGAPMMRDLAEAMKHAAELFINESGPNALDDPDTRKTYDALLRQASLVLALVPEMDALDRQMYGGESSESEPEEENPS